jgi:hypothetical protein
LTVEENVPAGHAVCRHDAAGQNPPAGHGSGAVVSGGHTCPAGHGVQVEVAAAAGCGADGKVPAGQSTVAGRLGGTGVAAPGGAKAAHAEHAPRAQTGSSQKASWRTSPLARVHVTLGTTNPTLPKNSDPHAGTPLTKSVQLPASHESA